MSKPSNLPEKSAITLPGVVEKVIKSDHEPEKAQIAIEGADELYREIRIENTLENASGEQVALKPGVRVEVTVEAPPQATTARKSKDPAD